MSELHIRINKRTLERVVFIVIIAVLGFLLFTQQPAGAADSSQVPSLQAQVDNLSALNADLRSQVQNLSSQVSSLESENQGLEQQLAEPEPAEEQEPEEPELSGEIGVTWSPTMTDDDKLDYVTVVLENGLESTQTLTYKLIWKGGDIQSNNVHESGSVTVSSGERETEVIDDYLSSPGEYYDTLILTITDDDDETVFEDEKEVR